ncbi:MAG: hypothetical protein DI551_11945 [Micavibrio aeruginosavorus]|uniref:Uncharacterized protein n=1 Tax=Micavibrio aeruginosavorus TaxID=349221 RepID=A0A2W5MQS7_9BACT|nr:MAG: hypothetical protein DI551_11945 [Micavibrio aeruginosavorus]
MNPWPAPSVRKKDKKIPARVYAGGSIRTFDQEPGIFQVKSAKFLLSFLGTTESIKIFDYLT